MILGLPLGEIASVGARIEASKRRPQDRGLTAWAPRGLDRPRYASMDRGIAWIGRMLESLHAVWAKADGEIRSFGKGQAPQDAAYGELVSAAFECCHRLLNMQRLAGLVASLAAGLRAGQSFANSYARAKRAAGLVDFDDLIREAERLLLKPGMGDWVRFKLDRQTDHILVDEAQDTNEKQWNIVRALALEYFAGEGASGRHRTIFTVGDYKQRSSASRAPSPKASTSLGLVRREAAGVERDFLDLSMDGAFAVTTRSSKWRSKIGDLGHEAFGFARSPNPHDSHHAKRPGSVTFCVSLYRRDGDDEDLGEEGLVPGDATRRYETPGWPGR